MTTSETEITQERDALRAQVAAVEEWAKEYHWQWVPGSEPATFDQGVGAAAHDVLAALGDPGPWVDRLKTEGAREVLDKVQAVYDTQCPVGPERKFVAGARMAHQWWETVLGGLLEQERTRVLWDGGEGDV